MFLNYNRTVAKYVTLWLFTLGIYNVVFKRAVVRDLNVASGTRVAELPGAKYFFLNFFTLGIYGILWDVKFLKLCQGFLDANGSEKKIDTDTYRFVGMFPIARISVLSIFVKGINEVCKIYSDKQLEETEADDFLAVNRVRDVKEEDVYIPTNPAKPVEEIVLVPKNERPDDDIHKVAGFAVIEEYDPEKDQKRIAYRLQMEREARARERELAKNPVPVVEKPVVVDEGPKNYRRGKAWFVKVFAAMMAVFILPIVFIAVTVFALPPVYEDSFIGELGEKYDRLNSIEKTKKIVIIGGSSVAFGLDSYMMEQAFNEDYEIVNFGLYADLGTKVMMDLSKSNINKGDIIVLAPEMNAQTLSLYFNGDTMLQALDRKPLDRKLEMLLYVDWDDYDSLIGSSLQFSANKISFLLSGERPNTGRPAYQKDQFNDYGDIIYDRPYNEMPSIQNVITLDYSARLTDKNVTDYDEYIEYVNDYVKFCERKGATVYFSFCPMNEAAMSVDNMTNDGRDTEVIDDFYENLCKVLRCRVISNVYDYILDEGYFYDSEFHLNNAGVTVRTALLIDDIKRELEDPSRTPILDFQSGEELDALPKAPGFNPENIEPEAPVTPEDELRDAENAKDFVFEAYTMGGNTYYAVVGISDEGKTKDTLTIPDKYNGSNVARIDPYAFNSSTVLKKLYLGKNINAIQGNAFNGSSITEVHIHDDGLGIEISVPNNLAGDLAVNGCAPGLKIFVPKADYADFLAEYYFWGDYSLYLAEKP